MTKLLVRMAVLCVVLLGVRQANATPCNDNLPSSNEVYLYSAVDGYTFCSAVSVGIYSTAASVGLYNDSIRSVNVGSAVRLRVFVDDIFEGAYADFENTNGNIVTLPYAFMNAVSSLRVVPSWRAKDCSDLQYDEFALYRDPNFKGDCVVLNYSHGNWVGYTDPAAMGIANDSISSVRPGPAVAVAPGTMGCPRGGFIYARLYGDANFNGGYTLWISGQSPLNVGDDWASSVQTVPHCY